MVRFNLEGEPISPPGRKRPGYEVEGSFEPEQAASQRLSPCSQTINRLAALFKIIASLLVVSAFMTGCLGTKPILKIGLVAPFEGLGRPLGYDVLYAVKVAIQERNSSGGTGGYMVALVALDDGDDPKTAIQRAREMTTDPDVVGVIGHFSLKTCRATEEEYQRAGLATLSPLAQADFSIYAPDELTGAEAARYAVEELKASRFALLCERESLAEAFIGEAERLGGNAVARASLACDDRKVLEARPDLIFFCGPVVEAADCVQKLRQAGSRATFMGGSEMLSQHWLKAGREASEGAFYIASTPPLEEIPAWEDFASAYQALAGHPPGPYAALAYDAANVLLAAIERAAESGRPTREAVAAALKETNWRGFTGPIAFDAEGNRLETPLYMYQIVESRSVVRRIR